MKLIKSSTNIIDKFKFDQIYILSDQKRSKSQNILTFSNKFENFDVLIDLFDLLFDFKVVFFDLVIQNRSKVIGFNQKEIKIRSKS